MQDSIVFDEIKIVNSLKNSDLLTIIKTKIPITSELFNIACRYSDLIIIVHLVEHKYKQKT